MNPAYGVLHRLCCILPSSSFSDSFLWLCSITLSLFVKKKKKNDANNPDAEALISLRWAISSATTTTKKKSRSWKVQKQFCMSNKSCSSKMSTTFLMFDCTQHFKEIAFFFVLFCRVAIVCSCRQNSFFCPSFCKHLKSAIRSKVEGKNTNILNYKMFRVWPLIQLTQKQHFF